MRDWQRTLLNTHLYGTIYQPIVLAAVAIAFFVIGSYRFAAFVLVLAALSFLLWWKWRRV